MTWHSTAVGGQRRQRRHWSPTIAAMHRRSPSGAAFIRWQASAGRTLEVRDATTPWDVLVVEVMSQQTQIERVGRKWRAFVARWPTPAALAGAETRHLLEAWAGLGYNRRALALREAARAIVDDHGGEVPSTIDALCALPGVGPYTARAVLATAFGKPVAPLDVNVRRVISRVVGGDPDPRTLQDAADSMVWRRDPKRWAWAVMDLAAKVCTSRAPRCVDCPIRSSCESAGTLGEPTVRLPRVPFEATNRWLRGQILRGLRSSTTGGWIAFEEPIGEHGRDAVDRALGALESEGFLERDGTSARLA